MRLHYTTLADLRESTPLLHERVLLVPGRGNLADEHGVLSAVRHRVISRGHEMAWRKVPLRALEPTEVKVIWTDTLSHPELSALRAQLDRLPAVRGLRSVILIGRKPVSVPVDHAWIVRR